MQKQTSKVICWKFKVYKDKKIQRNKLVKYGGFYEVQSVNECKVQV